MPPKQKRKKADTAKRICIKRNWCTNCGEPVKAQHFDRTTGKRYCKPCFRVGTQDANGDDLCCFVCLSETAPVVQSCKHSSGCQREVRLCVDCKEVHDVVPCVHCHAKHNRNSCLTCGAHHSKITNVKSLTGRLCNECRESSGKKALRAQVTCMLCSSVGSPSWKRYCERDGCLAHNSPGCIVLCDECLANSSARAGHTLSCLKCWAVMGNNKCYVCAATSRQAQTPHWEKHLCRQCAQDVATRHCYFCKAEMSVVLFGCWGGRQGRRVQRWQQRRSGSGSMAGHEWQKRDGRV